MAAYALVLPVKPLTAGIQDVSNNDLLPKRSSKVPVLQDLSISTWMTFGN
jgi:hypothetical protein